MAVEQPFLIECPACGIDNVYSDFTTGKSAVCNQCREKLLSPNLINSHKGHTCDNCDMAFILKNETEFMSGKSECQCGGSDFSAVDIGPFVAVYKQSRLPVLMKTKATMTILTGVDLTQTILLMAITTMCLMMTRGSVNRYFRTIIICNP